MLFELIFLVYFLPTLNCSLVIDSGKQKGIYLDNFCPSMKYCPEGSHVMCMYYNPHQVFGPRCNAFNVSMTPDIADLFLDVINMIRSRIARGIEKGQDGVPLPRGYGIFRLKWDSELATFAQVLANQCFLQRDECRASNRFPDPGQTLGLIRFSFPDWKPIGKVNDNIKKPGLYAAKLQYATVQALKSWYVQKKDVSKNEVVTFPYKIINPKHAQTQLYLEMIYGPSTHMGCGISAYSEYAYDLTTENGRNYNSIQIICNYSARPRSGSAVYNTVPPSDTDIPDTNCGCPIGSYSDSDCLCQYGSDDVHVAKSRNCKGASCEPTVVLLPIFSTEDASPQQIYDSLANMSKSMPRSSNEIKDIFDIFPDNNNNLRYQNKNKLMDTQKRFTVVHNPQSNYISTVKNRYFDKKYEPEPSEDRYRKSPRPTAKHVPKKTSSIFSRVTRFILPTKHSNTRDYNYNTGKKDVVPRKDFSDAKKLVDKYIYGTDNLYKPNTDIRSIYEDFPDVHRNGKEIFKNSKEDLSDLKDISPHKTEATLHEAEQNIIHHNEHENDLQKETIFHDPMETVTQQSDNKLMSLLDTLEREVKNIELHDKDKEIFDEKIRKIYGKIVGKPVTLLKHSSEIPKSVEKRNKGQIKSDIFNTEEVSDKHHHNNNIIHESFEMYDDPTNIEHHLEKILKDRNMYRNDEETKAYRTKSNYRDLKHNGINPEEHKYDDLDLNTYSKNPIKDHYNRHTASRIENTDEKRNIHKEYYMNNDRERGPLSVDRRKYYQDKLDNIERRLGRARNRKRHRAPEDHHMRAMLPDSTRKSEKHIDPNFYVADRARFVNGY